MNSTAAFSPENYGVAHPAGLLTSPGDRTSFPSRKTGTVAQAGFDHIVGVTVAGTAPDFHGIPFSLPVWKNQMLLGDDNQLSNELQSAEKSFKNTSGS